MTTAGIYDSQPELNGLLSLLSQLAQYFVANEAKISRHVCKSSIERLSVIERFSLQRLTVTMCLSRCTGSKEVVPLAGSVGSQHMCELSSSICPNCKYADVSVLLERFTPDSSDDLEGDLVNTRNQNLSNVELVDASTPAEDHTANLHVRKHSLFNEASANLTASRAPVRDTTEPGPYQGENISADYSCRSSFRKGRRSSLRSSTWNAIRGVITRSGKRPSYKEPSPSTNTEQPATGLLEEVISSPIPDVSMELSSRRASVLSDEAERIQPPRAAVYSSSEIHTDYDETGSDVIDYDEPDDEPDDDQNDEPDDDLDDDMPEDDGSHHLIHEILRGTNFETCSITLSHQLGRILKECSVDHSHFLRDVDESCLPNGGGFTNAFYKMHKRREKRDLCKIYQRFECLNLYRLAVGLDYHTGREWKWSAVDDLAEEIQIQYPHELFAKDKVKTRLKKHVRMGRRYNIWAEHLGNLGYLIALPLQVTPTE
ncbi:hypothetical protein PENANT_c108G00526 [Penicillium antarcticum]|uniref:Uncharacterized protein n=1 Tax=Penicillium antarcticum TaxID=416450 RepID=A0A1V6PL78_9EURO|nr:hypothetical protein PENANT_c108G00526 [Penicillium antarcticum]